MTNDKLRSQFWISWFVSVLCSIFSGIGIGIYFSSILLGILSYFLVSLIAILILGHIFIGKMNDDRPT